jgi:hypothetical protein
MIRKISLLLLLVCACPAIRAQQNTDRQMAGLKGPVRFVFKVDGSPNKSGKREVGHSTEYDRKGNEIEVIYYATNPFTHEAEKHHRVLSQMQNLTKTQRSYDFIRKSSKDRPPSIAGVIVNGKVQPLPPPPPPPVREPDGAILWQTLYKLDAQGNWDERIWYKGRAKVSPIISRNVYRRNAQGLIEEDLVFEADGSQSTRITHKYDENGIEIEYAEYEVKGVLRMKNAYSDFKLDRNGNWIARTVKMFYVRRDGTPVTTGQNEYREISYYPSAK